jgi:hypothetical protein
MCCSMTWMLPGSAVLSRFSLMIVARRCSHCFQPSFDTFSKMALQAFGLAFQYYAANDACHAILS